MLKVIGHIARHHLPVQESTAQQEESKNVLYAAA